MQHDEFHGMRCLERSIIIFLILLTVAYENDDTLFCKLLITKLMSLDSHARLFHLLFIFIFSFIFININFIRLYKMFLYVCIHNI